MPCVSGVKHFVARNDEECCSLAGAIRGLAEGVP